MPVEQVHLQSACFTLLCRRCSASACWDGATMRYSQGNASNEVIVMLTSLLNITRWKKERGFCLLESISRWSVTLVAASLAEVSWLLVRADQAVGCRKNHDPSSSRAALRGMLGSVVVICFTISSSASLQLHQFSSFGLCQFNFSPGRETHCLG